MDSPYCQYFRCRLVVTHGRSRQARPVCPGSFRLGAIFECISHLPCLAVPLSCPANTLLPCIIFHDHVPLEFTCQLLSSMALHCQVHTSFAFPCHYYPICHFLAIPNQPFLCLPDPLILPLPFLPFHCFALPCSFKPHLDFPVTFFLALLALPLPLMTLIAVPSWA